MKIITLIKCIFVASKFVSCATLGTRATFFLTLDWVVLLNDKSWRSCGRVKEETFLSYAAPGLTRKYKDYIKSRRYLFSFRYVINTSNFECVLCNRVQSWRKRFVRRFRDKARNIEEGNESSKLHNGGRIQHWVKSSYSLCLCYGDCTYLTARTHSPVIFFFPMILVNVNILNSEIRFWAPNLRTSETSYSLGPHITSSLDDSMTKKIKKAFFQIMTIILTKTNKIVRMEFRISYVRINKENNCTEVLQGCVYFKKLVL